MRTFYLKDLTLIGCTAWDEPVFPNLVSYIEKGEIRPLLARSFRWNRLWRLSESSPRKSMSGNSF